VPTGDESSISAPHGTGGTKSKSAQGGLFDIPRSRTAFGSRVFSTAGPQAWNQLPTDI